MRIYMGEMRERGKMRRHDMTGTSFEDIRRREREE